MVRIHIGRKLKHGLYNRYGFLIIPAGTILSIRHNDLLTNHEIDLDEADLECVDLSLEQNERLISHAAEEIKEIFAAIKRNQKVPLKEIEAIIVPSLYQVVESPDLSQVLSALQAKDDYTYRHNIGVAVFSNLIGKWLHLNEDAIFELTVAATLHDIGKVNIDGPILHKPGKLTDLEYHQMKKHAVFGYEIIKNTTGLSERLALVALQHHEREDGSGYPYGLKGDQIQFFSKIVAVADIFHALTTNRVYRKTMPFYKVIQIIREEGYGRLNLAIVNLFIQRIMEMSVGNQVRLTDGRMGKIIMIHSIVPERPLVQIENQYIDLSKEDHIKIESLSV